MHDFAGMLVFFGFLAAVIIVPQVLKSRDRQRMFETMRSAYDRGQPVPPEMVEAIIRPRGREADPLDYLPESLTGRDLRRGVVWTAVGAGFILIGAFFYAGLYDVGGAPQTFMVFASIGAIPFCVGLAFMGLWYFNRRRAPAYSASPPNFAAPPPASEPHPTPRSEL